MKFESPYGDHLPIFPVLYASPSRPLTEERIERTVERLVDYADRAFTTGKATQRQYDAWNIALNFYVRGLYVAAQINPTQNA